MEQIIELEKKINDIWCLVEIANGYCEKNIENSEELSNMKILLDIIISKQKEVMESIDSLYFPQDIQKK